MKKYASHQATGDAGDTLFASRIASVLQWPCRKMEQDIGIDRQVEIMNADGTSTGRFAAFQIKSTSQPGRLHAYVSHKDIVYWQSLAFPVFIVLVNVAEDNIFLQQFPIRNHDPLSRDGKIRIDFDPVKHCFSATSGKKIAAAATQAALTHIREHLDPIREGIREIRKAIASLENSPNGEDFVDLIIRHNDWKVNLAQARRLSQVLKTGTRECTTVARQLGEALSDLHDAFEPSYHDWNDDGRLTQFFEHSGWRVD
ncbi:DUF4365 domain-containing protein [Burkholderia gladioli]|uniref:DUF4365 domain-containing protein n=1 Tax=Burkholderia gladioli TaxID=28095 RepID=UPI00163FC84F|nr:DUF4365 domain-containing protein [Burkholderia gladioli]